MNTIRELVNENREFLLEARRYFHSHAELSGKEYETSAYIRSWLDKWDIPYVQIPEHTSIVAVIKGDHPGKTIAVRGDFDALPIQENTGCEYASIHDGVMHACGHDVHPTYLLGAAKILKDLRSELHGTVKLLFQEGEEIGIGAKAIIAAGQLDDVDEILGLHTAAGLDIGKFSTGYGTMSSYGGYIMFDVVGQEGHSSTPYKTVNALLVGTQIISALNAFAAYAFDSFDQAVLVPTILQSGSKSNIIPGTAHMCYNYRALDRKYPDLFDQKVRETAETIAALNGAHIENYFYRVPGAAVVNAADSVDRAIRLIREHFGDDAPTLVRPSMGGEDFSYYQQKVPGVMVHVGAARDGVYRVHHTDRTFMDDESIFIGEEFLLSYVFDYLNEGS